MTYDEALGQLSPIDADAVDTIDASIFSGDAFTNSHRRIALRVVMARWERRLASLGLASLEDAEERE